MPSLYEVSIPTFIHGLKTVSSLLSKGEAHYPTSAVKGSPQQSETISAIIGSLAYEIQRISHTSIKCAVLVAKVNDVAMVDNEASVAELQERIGMTISFLKSITPQMMEGRDSEDLVITTRAGERKKLTAKKYVLEHAIPNFYFYFGMVYALLREVGVPVERQDYLNLGTPYDDTEEA